MLIDIKDIAREGGVVEKTVPIGALPQEWGEPVSVGPTTIHGLLTRGSRGIDFAATLETRITLTCVRCLETFEMPVATEFHLIFVPRMPVEGKGEFQLHGEDCDLCPAPEGKVDLAALVREQLLLSLPAKPLCRQDCSGLCPRCGANRNVTACDCDGEAPEPSGAVKIPFPSRGSEN